MAFGRLERTEGPRPMSDINVTPLVDVMLVLVVILIITAPLMASSLRLDLPRAEGARPADAPTCTSCRSGSKRASTQPAWPRQASVRRSARPSTCSMPAIARWPKKRSMPATS